MSLTNLRGSGNSLVGPRDGDDEQIIPRGMIVCSRCREIAKDATDDGEELCEVCVQKRIEDSQDALELQQQIILEEIWRQSKP